MLNIHGKSRVRKNCLRGSVRGALGNWRPYRDQRREPMYKNRI